jgi:hypothetical protein
MKKALVYCLILSAFWLRTGLQAQNDTSGCFTMERAALLAQTDTSLARIYADLFREFNEGTRGVNSVITIPVVVHVVYNTPTENISQQQVQSAIDVLNEDYRRANLNWTSTNPNYSGLAADCEINFCLVATTRTYTIFSDFPVNNTLWTYGDVDYVKNIAPGYGQGYLNMWVCDIQGSMYGYAVFPGMAPSQYDGITVDYQYFGRTGAANVLYAGRTVTHETGHWLGLFHIWGMNTGAYGSYCDDDFVNDTWPQHRSNPNQCNYDYTSCPNYGSAFYGPYTGMNENFMDYTQGSCMTFFSAGQKQRITAMILTYRPYLISSPISCNTSINEANAAEITFSYNCSSGTVRFEGQNPLEGAELIIYDAAGKTIAVNNNYKSLSANVYEYPLPPLAAGTYFLSFSTNGHVSRNKLVVF